MPTLTVYLDGEGALSDVAPDRIANGAQDKPLRVMGLANGMSGGSPSVAIAIPLPHGGFVVGQTSLKLFLTAADALRARFGDPRG